MKIGDKVYAVSTDSIEEIISIENYKNIIYTMKKGNRYNYDELLDLRKCANIFANKELEQLILNYKK